MLKAMVTFTNLEKNYTNCQNYWDNLWYVLLFWEKFKIYLNSTILCKKSMLTSVIAILQFIYVSAKLLWFNQNGGWKLL